jgi:putative oxidoreductase
MRRLFSTFAHGLPAVGLLLLRLTVGITLIDHGITVLITRPPFASSAFYYLLVLLGVLLIVGLWTPIAGALVTLGAIGETVWHTSSWRQCVFVAVIAAALALLGPGAWSVDARLYGWRQIKISDRNRRQDPPI